MSLDLENINDLRAPEPDPEPGPAPAPSRARTTTPFWRRPWILPLMAVAAAWLYFQIEPVVGVPQDQLFLPPHDGFSAYYPLLITHMSGGTLAVITMCFQVWPRLRERFPRIHRISGLLYIAGAVIGGGAGLIIVWWAPVAGKLGGVCMLLFWEATTIAAYRAARRKHYAAHRKFMLYSFAVPANNFWAYFTYLALDKLHVVYDFNYFLEYSRWIPWVGNVILVQWWLYRTARRKTPYSNLLERV